MRFLSIYKTAERSTPPTAEEMAAMGKLVEEGMKAGWLLATEGCRPTALGARVRRANGDLLVTDGPFTEFKEVVGGFAIMKANSKQEAVELLRQFLQVAGDGECELRQLCEVGADQSSCHESNTVAAGSEPPRLCAQKRRFAPKSGISPFRMTVLQIASFLLWFPCQTWDHLSRKRSTVSDRCRLRSSKASVMFGPK